MKKIIKIVIVVLAMMFIISMCSSCNTDDIPEPKYVQKIATDSNDKFYIIELTFDGKTHEFVKWNGFHQGGLTHWPDCKFCEKDNIK